MKAAISKPGKFFINENGNLLAANPQTRTPLSCSHIQRVRVELMANATTISIVTGMNEDDQVEMMGEMSVAWLIAYLSPKKVKAKMPDWVNDVEGDVYDLLKTDTVRGWWRNNHIQRDAEMLPLLCDYHAKAFAHARKKKGYNMSDAKKFAQAKTTDKYHLLHNLCMTPTCYHYHKLEDSYAKIW